jgi:hypothetical protein
MTIPNIAIGSGTTGMPGDAQHDEPLFSVFTVILLGQGLL